MGTIQCLPVIGKWLIKAKSWKRSKKYKKRTDPKCHSAGRHVRLPFHAKSLKPTFGNFNGFPAISRRLKPFPRSYRANPARPSPGPAFQLISTWFGQDFDPHMQGISGPNQVKIGPKSWKRGKDPHPQDFSLTKKTARFTKGQFRPY